MLRLNQEQTGGLAARRACLQQLLLEMQAWQPERCALACATAACRHLRFHWCSADSYGPKQCCLYDSTNNQATSHFVVHHATAHWRWQQVIYCFVDRAWAQWLQGNENNQTSQSGMSQSAVDRNIGHQTRLDTLAPHSTTSAEYTQRLQRGPNKGRFLHSSTGH